MIGNDYLNDETFSIAKDKEIIFNYLCNHYSNNNEINLVYTLNKIEILCDIIISCIIIAFLVFSIIFIKHYLIPKILALIQDLNLNVNKSTSINGEINGFINDEYNDNEGQIIQVTNETLMGYSHHIQDNITNDDIDFIV